MPLGQPFRKAVPGQQPSAADHNRLVDEVERLSAMGAQPPLEVANNGGSPPMFRYVDGVIIAKITSATTGACAWTEQQRAASGAWQDAPGGRSGTLLTNPAYEANQFPVSVNTVHRLLPDGSGSYRFWSGQTTTGSISSIGLDMPPGWAVTPPVLSSPGTFEVSSPMKTTGDMIYRATTGEARLPIGGEGQLLISSGGIPTWSNQINISTTGVSVTNLITTGATLINPILINATGLPRTIDYYQTRSTSGRSGQVIYPSGCLQQTGAGITSYTCVQNQIAFTTWICPAGGVADQLSFFLISGGAGGGRLRLAVYSNFSDSDQYPYELLADVGDVDISSGSNLLKTFPVLQTFNAGILYWLCVMTSGTATSSIRGNNPFPVLGMNSDWTATRGWYSGSRVYTSGMPAIATTGMTAQTINAPMVGVRLLT